MSTLEQKYDNIVAIGIKNMIIYGLSHDNIIHFNSLDTKNKSELFLFKCAEMAISVHEGLSISLHLSRFKLWLLKKKGIIISREVSRGEKVDYADQTLRAILCTMSNGLKLDYDTLAKIYELYYKPIPWYKRKRRPRHD